MVENRQILLEVHLPVTLKEVLIGFGLAVIGGLS